MTKILNILPLLSYITFFFEVLPAVFVLFFLKRNNTKDRQVFFWYCLATTLSVFFIILFRYIYPNKWIFYFIPRIHTVIEFSLLTYLFSIFLKSTLFKKIATFSILPFTLLCCFDFLRSKEPSVAYVPLLVECSFFIIFIIYFFFEKLKQDVNEPLFSTFVFWFSVALLINSSGNFLLFVYSETSNKDVDFRINYAIIYSTVTIVKNILLCVAVTMKETIITKASKNLQPDIDLAIFNPHKP